MRKIYSLVLIAAALLVGTNMWADVNVAHVENFTKQTSGDYTTLKAAFDAIGAGDSAKITLLASTEVGEVILMDGGNDNQADGKIINLDLGNQDFSITGTNSNRCIFVLAKGKLDITGKGIITFETQAEPDVNYYTTTHTAFNNNSNVKPWMERNQGVCIAVMGSVDPTQTNWSRLIIGENVTLTAAYAAVQLQAISSKVSDLYGYWEIKNTTQNYYNYYYSAWKDTKTLNENSNVTLSDIWTKCNDGETIVQDNTGTYKKQRPNNATLGFGYGINIDIYGHLVGKLYGLQIKGTITANPDLPRNNANAKFPRINVRPGSTIAANSENTPDFPREDSKNDMNIDAERKQPTAIYASGYAIWDIQGTVTGANGVYVKMGQIVVQGDANISSNANDASVAHHTSSGVSGVGNAITLQSDWSDGTMGITIKADDNGGTPEISSSANGGAAIVETATIPEDPNSQVQNITIEAGDFSGDVNGCVVISDNFDGDISVSGGTYTGSIETLIDAMDEGEAETIIQTVVSQEGETATVVIGTINTAAGDEIVVVPENEDVAFEGVNEHSVVKLKANSSDISKILSNDVTMKYLSLTGTGSYTTTVTIPDGKTMTVDQIVMDANGRIIVQAGGKLVVTGSNGIFADDVNNLVLEAVEGNQSIFLFNPNVKTNRNPKATVEFVSKAYYENSTDYVWQRFGIPTISALTNFTCSNPLVQTQVSRFDNNNGWVKVGYINPTPSHTAEELNPADLDQPFGYYELIGFQSKNAPALTYTMSGSLVGNSNPILNAATKWNGFSNSYTGNISMEKLYESLDGTGFDASVYTYRRNGTGKNMTWEAVNEIADNFNEYPVLEPMQPFLLVNKGAATSHTLQYSTLVYNGGAGYSAPTPTLAPARSSNAQITRVKIHVEREDGAFDNVVLAQDNQFSADYENGRDAEKYMNKHMNIFVTDDAYLNVLATNNLNDTYLGFSCAEGGTYEISFEKVQGKSFTLIDLETNAQVQIEEGTIYQFNVEDNYASDYRFKVVGRQEMPTEIEEVENATINNGGIYTITGQYLGDMNLWNTLPAGLYIVNGEKKIK